MSEKFSTNRKRYVPTSIIKVKKLKVPDCVQNEETFEEENCSKEETKMKKLVTMSQPVLKQELKSKLNALLSNWKPPLKNTPNETHKLTMKTDSIQDSEMKQLKCDDIISETKQIEKITSTNSAEIKFKTLEKNSFENDNYNVNLEEKSLYQDQETYNDNLSSTSLNQQSLESTIHETHITSVLNERKAENVPVHEINECEVTKQRCDSQEDTLNEKVNAPYLTARAGYLTPEVTRTPPTPPTLKVSWLNSNGEYDLGPSASKNITPNESTDIPLNMHKQSPTKLDTYNEADLLFDENANLYELLNSTDLELLTENSLVDSLETECELDLNTLHSQLNSLENNQSTSVTPREQELNPPRYLALEFNPTRELAQELAAQRELAQELTAQRELAQENNPPKELAQLNHPREQAHELTNFGFTPFHPTTLTPKMPKINWVHQIQEHKKQLQAVVREISQLNAMMTRTIREIWPARNPQ